MTDPTPFEDLPIVVAGGGPVGLITALGLVHYGLPVVVLEEDDRLSLDTKAGTVLTRTLEVLHRYDSVDEVLRNAVRVDEIGELDRATNTPTLSVLTGDLTEDTRFPFVINIPQNEMEPVLADQLERHRPGSLRMGHRLVGFSQDDDAVTIEVEGPEGPYEMRASYLLGCDGGRSRIRANLDIEVEGKTLEDKYMLVDLNVDLDINNPRDYPYLAYFGDPEEWMVLVRQPHHWRFLFPLHPGVPEPTREELGEKVARFIGETDSMEIVHTNIYSVHHRVAGSWNVGRIFLMGDAAHLITPMWALGLNTGVLDSSNLPWRLAWVRRGWAKPSLLAGYEQEQAPIAIKGSGELAEAARANMDRRADGVAVMGDGNWGNAYTRSLLGVSLDVDGDGDWSMAKMGDDPLPIRPGDRAPDLPVYGPDGQVYVHDLCSDSFVALYFTDARRRPEIPEISVPGLKHWIVSRWDAPHNAGQRHTSLFDPADRVRRRYGLAEDCVVLLRPDSHVAAILPFNPKGDRHVATRKYLEIVGKA